MFHYNFWKCVVTGEGGVAVGKYVLDRKVTATTTTCKNQCIEHQLSLNGILI